MGRVVEEQPADMAIIKVLGDVLGDDVGVPVQGVEVARPISAATL